MRMPKLLLVLFMLASFAAEAKLAPVENLAFRQFDGQSERTTTPANVKAAVVEALRPLNGSITEEQSGALILRLTPRTHVANVRLAYDAKGFSITYLSSENLDYVKKKDVDYIHANYNAWVNRLAEGIAQSPLLWFKPEQLADYKPPRAYDPSSPILITTDIPFAPGAGTPEFRQQCNFGKLLSDSIVENSDGKIKATSSPLAEQSGQVLEIFVTHLYAVGGGGFSGPKWARIEGRLRQGDELVGSFGMQRTTGAAFRFSACSTMEKVAVVLGEDVANWGRKPTVDATVK